MAADLHIHAIPDDFPAEVVYDFLGHAIGSKHFSWARVQKANDPEGERFNRIHATDNIWIGEVSWVKAVVFEDADAFIPSTVAVIADVIGEDLPVLSLSFRDVILATFDMPNTTGYRLAERATVDAWLSAHMGQRLFTVSW